MWSGDKEGGEDPCLGRDGCGSSVPIPNQQEHSKNCKRNDYEKQHKDSRVQLAKSDGLHKTEHPPNKWCQEGNEKIPTSKKILTRYRTRNGK